MIKTAIRVTQWLKNRREQASDRGETSITTVIIIVALVAGALLIAGTLAVVFSRYNTALTGV
ncbi:hypothetical protein ACFYYB_26190 [Streptomyces sp. NPDC002886]|uniref:hypothetical protein n=1 Tax=Streptomyces sp. NPDC002886 TaxID=3364667 RepID=UPI003686C991